MHFTSCLTHSFFLFSFFQTQLHNHEKNQNLGQSFLLNCFRSKINYLYCNEVCSHIINYFSLHVTFFMLFFLTQRCNASCLYIVVHMKLVVCGRCNVSILYLARISQFVSKTHCLFQCFFSPIFIIHCAFNTDLVRLSCVLVSLYNFSQESTVICLGENNLNFCQLWVAKQ